MLEEFVIKIGFAPDGTVDEVRYWDQEGCGHEKVVSLGDDLDDVIQYHLKHMYRSHGQAPKVLCGVAAQVTLPDGSTEHAVCRLEPHGPEAKHRFEVY